MTTRVNENVVGRNNPGCVLQIRNFVNMSFLDFIILRFMVNFVIKFPGVYVLYSSAYLTLNTRNMVIIFLNNGT